MKEKLNFVQMFCGLLGSVILIIYIVLAFVRNASEFILVIKLITAAIALILFSIRCGAEIVGEERCWWSFMMMGICLFDVGFTAIQLARF